MVEILDTPPQPVAPRVIPDCFNKTISIMADIAKEAGMTLGATGWGGYREFRPF